MTKRVNFNVSDQAYTTLSWAANSSNVSMTEWFRQAANTYLYLQQNTQSDGTVSVQTNSGTTKILLNNLQTGGKD